MQYFHLTTESSSLRLLLVRIVRTDQHLQLLHIVLGKVWLVRPPVYSFEILNKRPANILIFEWKTWVRKSNKRFPASRPMQSLREEIPVRAVLYRHILEPSELINVQPIER